MPPAPAPTTRALPYALEIGGGVLAILTFCFLAGGASPTPSAAHRKPKLPAPVASASASASASTAPAPPTAAPAPSPSLVVLASASAPAPAIASAPVEAVRGHRPRANGAGSPDLDGDRVRITPGTRVLLFGDSMAQSSISARLGELVKARGGTLEFDGWTSSTTAKWAAGDRLSRLLERVNPDVVFIVLGSNECFLGDPSKAVPHVKSIVSQLAGRACVWVGPPVWKGETGIVGVERDGSSPCAFYDSGKLAIERYDDGIHPSYKGGIHWGDEVWKAAVEQSPGNAFAGR
jgi:hypothetical protein